MFVYEVNYKDSRGQDKFVNLCSQGVDELLVLLLKEYKRGE